MRDLETRRQGLWYFLFLFHSNRRNPKIRETFRGLVPERATIKKGSVLKLLAFNKQEGDTPRGGYVTFKLQMARVLQKAESSEDKDQGKTKE